MDPYKNVTRNNNMKSMKSTKSRHDIPLPTNYIKNFGVSDLRP